MTPRRQWQIWAIGLSGAIVLVWVFRPILLPFVAGMAIAYLLDPIADKLVGWRVNRALATSIIIGGAILVIVLAIGLLIPLLQSQITAFAKQLPVYLAAVIEVVKALAGQLSTVLSDEQLARLREAASSYAGNAIAWVVDFLGGVVSGGVAFLNLVSLLFITPVVAFYLLLDWDRLVERIDGLLPRDHADDVRELVRQIDTRLAGFVRGQLIVAAILGVFYAVALSVVGLELGLVVGLAAGLLSVVPFVGSIGGFIVSVGLALIQFDTLGPVAIVAVVFIAGQVAEGNFLTPRLVGDRIGLHPVWMIFALLAGGALLGMVGLLLAVPVAAVISVLVEFAAARYQASRLYLGVGASAQAPPDNDVADTGADDAT